MDVLIILVFVSLVLVCGGLMLFVFGLRQGDFEHGERLSLLPLDEDDHAFDNRGEKAVRTPPSADSPQELEHRSP